MLYTLVTILHVLFAVVLIAIVLFQHGKGASIGATFGGSSQTLFGPRGPASALAKITTAVAVMFMVTSISLSVISNQSQVSTVIPEGEEATLPTELPDQPPVKQESPAGPSGAAAPSPGPAADEGPVDGPVAEPSGGTPSG
ncbi:MAG: preprotein translocase subunit SecG [Candidatus Nitrospinota bacterium M3_3B_026]